MKKMYSMLLLSMGSMLQGMEQKEIVSLTSDRETTSQSASAHPLSMPDFWTNFTPYLLYSWGPQVATESIKASSCVDKNTFAVFKNTRLKDVIINLFERYALSKAFTREEVLGNLFPVLFTNAQEVKALYADENVIIEAFVETLKSCAQNKDWSSACAQLEVIRKESRLTLQLNNAYWDVNPHVRMTVLSYALLLNAPQELIKLLINSGAPVTNLSPKVLPPLLIMAMKTTGAATVDPLKILSEKMVSAIPNEVVDRTSIKELITLLCASGAQIQDVFDNSSVLNRYSRSLSTLDWAIVTRDKDLLEHLLLLQKDIQQIKTILFNPCALAIKTVVNDHMIPSRNDIQRLAGEECFELLLHYSKNNVAEIFGFCSHIIASYQHYNPGLQADQVAELAKSITTLLSLFIKHGADINHLIDKKTILDRAQDEGWHKIIIDFLIEKGARNSSCEFTQEEIKTQTFRKVLQDIFLKLRSRQPIEQEKMRDLLKAALEIVKTPSMNFGGDRELQSTGMLAIDLGVSLDETLEFLMCLESRNLFCSDSPSYGNISSVFHQIVSWLHDVKKRTFPENVFNEWIKRESLRSLLVKLAQKGVKDKPNSEGKTAAQKAYELGFEEIAHLIRDSVSKS